LDDLDNKLLFAGMVVEAAIIGLLIYRRVWRTLPFFCIYVVGDLLSAACGYALQRQPAGTGSHSYLAAYFWLSLIDSILEIAVLIELGWSTLSPLRASLSARALPLIVLLILGISAIIWPFIGVHDLAAYDPIWRNITHLEQTTTILRIVFFMVLAGCSQLLSIGWRDRELQVATGLGIYSLVSVSVDVLREHQQNDPHYLHQFVVGSYLCSLLYWGFSFAQKEAARREFTPKMENFLLAVAGTAHSTNPRNRKD
jgi:hypothetical protein